MLYAEIDYSFEVEFDIVMSWHDTSIFRRCNGVNPWATDPVPCPEVWRPTIGIYSLCTGLAQSVPRGYYSILD